MAEPFERRDADDPRRGRQPKYERLVMKDADQFAMTAGLPSGERVDVPLGPFTWDGFFDSPSDRSAGP